jgi:uncharacterized hydrophobic protein (TIGR00341 family)
MRSLTIHAPANNGRDVLKLVEECGAVNVALIKAHESEREIALVTAQIPNRALESLLERLEKIEDAKVTIVPRGMLPLRPPADEAPEQVRDVELRAPVEILLGGLQSIGSWQGFLGYALCAGVVTWIGLFTNTIYLLTASMLISPFAGPVMNLALGTARGDSKLVGRSLLRCAASLSLSIAVALTLSVLMRQKEPTQLMVEIANVSSVAVLLALITGVAGGLNIIQSERSSLVSGAAAGMLVAASLAPPTGIIGMAIATGAWDMARAMVFLLLLNLAGINLSAALIFRWAGISPQGVRFPRGKAATAWSTGLATLVALGTLIAWQFSSSPDLRRSSQQFRAETIVREAVESSGLAQIVEVDARFTRPSRARQNTLLIVVYALGDPTEAAETALTERMEEAIRAHGLNVTPLIDLTLLAPP